MSLTDRDIQLFARAAVDFHSDVLEAKSDARKAYCLRQHRLAAVAYYHKSQDDVRGSGYRVTKRVRDSLWAELERIATDERSAVAEEAAPAVIEAAALSTFAMTTGGEKTHPRVICDGEVREWVGFGWVSEGEATPADRAELPVVRGRALAASTTGGLAS